MEREHDHERVDDVTAMIVPIQTVPNDRVRSSTASFERFYGSHRDGLVRALAMTIGDDGLAADAVDEAMARAFQRWKTVSEYDRPQSWVYRVAFNWATSRFRRRKRDREYAPKIARPESTVDLVEDPDLEDALNRLSQDHRAVLVLRFLKDWDVTMTAEALGVSPGTVKSRTSRALDHLTRTLGETALRDLGS